MPQGSIWRRYSVFQSEYNVSKLLVIGLVFHLVFIRSVFDCYFTSPVVSGMERYNVGSAEAKRLVLIIGDGLRADLLFNLNPFPGIPGSPKIVAPYLRSVAETKGAFGISHTRVPTESRPGHVAIIGGMYEDVSAVTKGWKANPVDFDSIFNQSSSTFSFGSPDILPMFARGATPGKVKTWSYNEAEEDFTKDATALDLWVLDQLKLLFHNATLYPNLEAQLRSDKTVFFLHLLGLDTTGHSYRPHSREYMRNIEIVDSIVRQTELLFNEFYNDQETSFIFTADHGMSTIGNHGDGNPDNTRTPLIAWGRGIRGPLLDTYPSSHDSYSEPWGLKHLVRRDVEQADIAALMATLIGINWPVNSVGVIPDVDTTLPGYLATKLGDETSAKVALTNAKVLLEHYRVKHELKQRRALFYQPYKPLEGVGGATILPRQHQVTQIENFIASQQWSSARNASAAVIKSSLKGLHYLQTYDRLFIRIIVTTAYTGWAAYAALYIFRPNIRAIQASSRYPAVISGAAIVILCSSWTMLFLQRSPWSFYVYTAFPCFFWREVLIALLLLRSSFKLGSFKEYAAKLFYAVVVFGLLQGMVAAYTYRFIWSIGFILIGVVWPSSWSHNLRISFSNERMLWSFLCLVTAIFPLLSVDKVESLLFIMSGAYLIMICGWFASGYFSEESKAKDILEILHLIQIALIMLMVLITGRSVRSLRAKEGLPLLNQSAGWVILAVSSLIPFFANTKNQTVNSKLLMYFLGFGPCFVILSISVEGLFYTAYTATLTMWIHVERTLAIDKATQRGTTRSSKYYRFEADDLRIALFFLFFVQVGFFGIGNVASISSFYLEPVYRLIPRFNPFFMASLLMFKIVAPYVILAVTFAVLNDALHLPPFSLLVVALTLTDGMTLTFFFNVKDTGSWLEIGQSITFFCISSLLLLWSAGICAAGEYLMADVLGHSLPSAKLKTK